MFSPSCSRCLLPVFLLAEEDVRWLFPSHGAAADTLGDFHLGKPLCAMNSYDHMYSAGAGRSWSPTIRSQENLGEDGQDFSWKLVGELD